MQSTTTVQQSMLFGGSAVPEGNDASTDLRHVSKRHSGDPAPYSLKPGIGTNQCVCMGCGEGFNSVYGFERHQRIGSDGRTICIHPLAITAKDGTPKPMLRNARGWWITAAREMDGAS